MLAISLKWICSAFSSNLLPLARDTLESLEIDVHIRFMGGFTPYFQELEHPSRIQVPSEVIAEVEHKDWDEGLCFHEIRSRIL